MERYLTTTWRTRLLPLGFAALLAGNALAQHPGNPPAWSVLNLGTLDGVQSDNTNFADLNNRGQVVGTAVVAASSVPCCGGSASSAFLYDSGRMTAIPLPKISQFPLNENAGLGINDRGQVIGIAADTLRFVGAWHPYLYSGGQHTSLSVSTSHNTWPVGINERGDVLLQGYPEPGAALNYSGHIYSNGTLRNIGTLGGPSTSPRFINDRGQVAGISRPSADTSAEQGFFYSEGRMVPLATSGTAVPNALNNAGQVAGSYNGSAAIFHQGQITSLGKLGGQGSEFRDINDAGQAIGSVDFIGEEPTAYLHTHAFFFSDGQVQDLHTSFSYAGLSLFSTLPVDINERGQVLVEARFSPAAPDGGGIVRYFLWDGGHVTDLSAMLPRGFIYRAALNDVGQVIFNVNTGINPGSPLVRPYLLTPIPEPSTYALVLAGLGTLAYIARRRAHKQSPQAGLCRQAEAAYTFRSPLRRRRVA